MRVHCQQHKNVISMPTVLICKQRKNKGDKLVKYYSSFVWMWDLPTRTLQIHGTLELQYIFRHLLEWKVCTIKSLAIINDYSVKQPPRQFSCISLFFFLCSSNRYRFPRSMLQFFWLHQTDTYFLGRCICSSNR